MIKTSEEWRKEFTDLGCIRVYGQSCKEHAALAHKVHSDTITDCWPFLSDPARVRAACTDLLERLELYWERHPTFRTHIDRFIGPPVSGWPMAFMLADLRGVEWALAREHIEHRSVSATQRGVHRTDQAAGEDIKYFSFKGAALEKNKAVLIADDIGLTGRELSMTIDAAQKAGVIVVESVAVLINRLRPKDWVPGEVTQPRKLVHMRTVLSLCELPARYWPEENCALCKEGSTPVGRTVQWSVRVQS